MQRQTFSSNSIFEEEWRYKRAVKVGNTIYLSATGGWDYAARTMPETATEQITQTFNNIEKALSHFGASMSDLVQIQVIYRSQSVWDEILPILTEYFKKSEPTAIAFEVPGVPDPRVLVEIVATAVVQ